MNPITRARTMSTLSTTALAKDLKVSRQYLSKIEQGLYDKPNREVLNWAANTINKAMQEEITPEQIEELYKEWQWHRRVDTKNMKVLQPLQVTEFDKVSQPEFRKSGIIYYHKIFVQWRSDYWNSYHGFCVDMCLHPSPVAEYEEGKMHTMPNKLRQVLSDLKLIGRDFRTNER